MSREDLEVYIFIYTWNVVRTYIRLVYLLVVWGVGLVAASPRVGMHLMGVCSFRGFFAFLNVFVICKQSYL